MNTPLPNQPYALVGAGWHAHLDILVSRVNGAPAASFWSSWARLRGEYESRTAA